MDHKVDLKSVGRKTLSKQVSDEIINLLTSGQLKPGDRLPTELELMEMCNVSRPVMREALSSLEAMGIVQRKTRNGTYFSDKIGSKPFSMMFALSAGNLPSIMETRISLEVGLVTLAAEKITEDDLSKLKETIEIMSTTSDEEYSEADKEFHKIIAHSASNPLMESMIEPLLNLYDKTLEQIELGDRTPEITIQQHIDIYQALEKHDAFEAHAAMYRHLDYVRKRALKSIQV
jgi:DNA-binding FadR family transcriptional regulator